SFDAVNALSQIENLDADDASFVSFSMTRNRKNHVIGVSDDSDGSGGLHDAVFTFDALERLVSAQVGSGGAQETLAYQFDSLDNIVSKTSSLEADSSEHVGAYTYG